jgi:hypothetical protein
MALGIALLAFLPAMLLLRMGHFLDYGSLYNLALMLSTVGFAARGFLIVAAVHLEAIPGARLDWLIRPIRRKDLLLAKVLFVAMMVQVPLLMADLFEALADGFSVGPALGAALARSVLLLCVFDLPVLAFASLTQNMLEAVFGAVAILIGIAASTTVAQMIRPPMGLGPGPRMEWIGDLAVGAILLLGGISVLGLQYFRRRTVPARRLTAGVIALAFLATLLPFQAAFAIQQSLYRAPGVARAVAIGYAPGSGRFQSVPRYFLGFVTAYVPLQVSGMPAESVLVSDGLEIRISEPNGRTNKIMEFDRLVVLNDGGAYLPIHLQDEGYNQIKDQPEVAERTLWREHTLFMVIVSRCGGRW